MTPTNKNLQDLFKTYVAKSEDEEKFRKAHVISTVDNNDEKLGPKDDQFVATTKTYARDTSHHGYEAGGDEKVYSEAAMDEPNTPEAHYKADLPNILKDIRGKRKSHSDLRREYGGSWKRLANSTADEHGHNYNRDHLLAVGKQHLEDHASQINEMSSKMKMKLGLYGKKKKMEEEVEELDETSKAKLGRYINKAKDSIDMTSYRSGIKDGTAISRNDPYTSKNPLERKLSKRHKGIEMAVKKLTREEAELDEATLNPEDERHFEKQTPKMQAAINLHLRKGMDYEDAVAAARRVFSEEVEQTDKLSTAIKKKLSDEGGAAAFKPLKDTAMKMGINLTPEMLKNIPGVSQHDDGDYILKEEVDLDEKKLTKAELKKREEVATAMERDNPGMDMGKKMAIATAQAKKVAEEIELGEAVNSDDAFDRLEKAGAKDVKTTSGGIRYTHGGKEYNLRHNMKRTGHRTVRSAELEQHLNRLQEENEVVEEQFAPGKFKEAMIQRGLAALQEHIVGNE